MKIYTVLLSSSALQNAIHSSGQVEMIIFIMFEQEDRKDKIGERESLNIFESRFIKISC